MVTVTLEILSVGRMHHEFTSLFSETGKACKAKVDVGFILDSSWSARNEYQKEKDFLKAIAAAFQISDDGPIAGVITFSKDAEISIKLSDHSKHDTASFNNAVDDIAFMGQNTRIDKAFRLAQSQLFTVSNGGRPGVPKILIALIDGSQSPGFEDPSVIANEMRNAGIEVFIVGIGPEVSDSELIRLANNQADILWKVPTFDDLDNQTLVDAVVDRACPGNYSREVNAESEVYKALPILFKDVNTLVRDSLTTLATNYEHICAYVTIVFGLSECSKQVNIRSVPYRAPVYQALIFFKDVNGILW